MRLSLCAVLLALSTAHKVGLFTVAAIFIVFALAASFLLPRRDPDFPGRRLGLFLGAVVVLLKVAVAH